MAKLPVATAEQIQGYLQNLQREYPRMVAQAPDTSLARQVFNPGNRGQNARYDVSGLQRGDDGLYRDARYTYDAGGLSKDRPDSIIEGLPGAENLNGWYPGMPTPWLAALPVTYRPNVGTPPPGYTPLPILPDPSAQALARARAMIAQAVARAIMTSGPRPVTNPFGTLGPSPDRVGRIRP